jgi:hypothetical protein
VSRSDLCDRLEHFVKTLGVDPAGRVDLGLKRLVAHMASYAAGCKHTRRLERIGTTDVVDSS